MSIQPVKRPCYIVGIAGGSASGKSALAQQLVDNFEAVGTSASLVSIDWFYCAPVLPEVAEFSITNGQDAVQAAADSLQAGIDIDAALCKAKRADMLRSAFMGDANELRSQLLTQLKVERATYNWDEPAALDLAGVKSTLAQLSSREEASFKAFSFKSRQRATPMTVAPADVVIVEGLFAFASTDLESALNYKIFIHADKDTVWSRKRARDSCSDRGGQSEEYLRTQFKQAWDMYELHVLPTSQHEGVHVVCNDDTTDLQLLSDSLFKRIQEDRVSRFGDVGS